jgi:hypothetical protein
MNFALFALFATLALFLAMLLFLEMGRAMGARRLTNDPSGASAGISAVEGTLFGLLGLLIAFTFSGAMSRFDQRRQLIVDETNAIGTAYLRVDLLPPDAQGPARDTFRRYVDSRLAVYRKLPDVAAAEAELARSNQIQHEPWEEVVAACRASSSSSAPMLLLPAVNNMIDVTTSRTMATKMHPPVIIFVMLVAIALVTALLVGYDMAAARSRSWLHMVGFAAAIALAVYVILDTEYPRFGLIRVDAFDQALVDLRESMH